MRPDHKQILLGLALATAVSLVGCYQAQSKPLRQHKAHASRFVPAGCPRAWCGCWLARHLGLSDKRLWLAIEWARRFPRTSAHVGAVAVWPHHVGQIVGGRPGHWIVLSGNDGHRVRRRERSTRGVVAFVNPNPMTASTN